MKKTIILTCTICLTIFQWYCTPKASKVATSEKIETPEEIIAKFSSEQLDNGKVIWQSNCNKCHKLFDPGSRTPEKWDRVLRRMIPKAKLNTEDGTLVRAYLLANAKQEQ